MQDEFNPCNPAGAIRVFREVLEGTLQVIGNGQKELDVLREQTLSVIGVVQIDAAFVIGKTGAFTLEAVQVVFILFAKIRVFSL